jgi:hypothetical protein
MLSHTDTSLENEEAYLLDKCKHLETKAQASTEESTNIHTQKFKPNFLSLSPCLSLSTHPLVKNSSPTLSLSLSLSLSLFHTHTHTHTLLEIVDEL